MATPSDHSFDGEKVTTPMCRRTKSVNGRISTRVRQGILDGREIPADMDMAEVERRKNGFRVLMSRGMESAIESTGMTEYELQRCEKMKVIPDGEWFFIKLAVEVDLPTTTGEPRSI